jgi:hypothetical protein
MNSLRSSDVTAMLRMNSPRSLDVTAMLHVNSLRSSDVSGTVAHEESPQFKCYRYSCA